MQLIKVCGVIIEGLRPPRGRSNLMSSSEHLSYLETQLQGKYQARNTIIICMHGFSTGYITTILVEMPCLKAIEAIQYKYNGFILGASHISSIIMGNIMYR